MKPKALILQARGTNRDFDVADALSLAGAQPELVPLNWLRNGQEHFSEYQMLVVAGGFSYADALGAGKLLALDLRTYFADEIAAFVAANKPVIGICNGFQALVKSGILAGNVAEVNNIPAMGGTLGEQKTPVGGGASMTLTFNACGHFECRWVTLQPISQTCVWTRNLDEIIECPVSHGEGNFQVSDPVLINQLVLQDRVALVYTNPDGTPANGDYPLNPNGSILDIAGICNQQGNVLGLMPHPENNIHSYQHPRRTRGVLRYSGLTLFERGVEYASNL
jgi:phosphoribosylformylglycinamidine synthase